MTQRRVLIIDDEDDIRQVAALSLETVAGWDVLMAGSGMEGVGRAATFLELQKRKETAGISVVLLTAKVQGPDQRRFAGLGVAAVLFKPFDPLTLSTQISDALGWKD
jgi:CheY-like chemotaxis protein